MNEALCCREAQCVDVRGVKHVRGVKIAYAIAPAQGEQAERVSGLQVTAIRRARVSGCVDTVEEQSGRAEALSGVAIGDKVEARDVQHSEAVYGPGIDLTFGHHQTRAVNE